MIRRTIREWERISYGTDETEIPASHADKLAAEARASTFSGFGGEGVLEHGRKGLRARGVVGVIATPGCQLEILPKIEGAGESAVDDATLRHRLIHMLAVTRDIRIDVRAIAQLGWQRDTILELLIRALLQQARRRGAPGHTAAIHQSGRRPPRPARAPQCDPSIFDPRGLAAEAGLPVRLALARHRAQSGHAGGHRQAFPSCPSSGQPARSA